VRVVGSIGRGLVCCQTIAAMACAAFSSWTVTMDDDDAVLGAYHHMLADDRHSCFFAITQRRR
jgi:hypothetical protein